MDVDRDDVFVILVRLDLRRRGEETGKKAWFSEMLSGMFLCSRMLQLLAVIQHSKFQI